jgi:hypothetical protein
VIVLRSVGVACPRGLGGPEVLDGDAPVSLAPPAQPQFAGRRVGRVPEFDAASQVAQRKSLKLMSRASLLAVAAARELALPDGARAEAGLYLGVGMSGGEIAQLAGLLDESLDERGGLALARMGASGLARLNPLLSFHVLNNMPLCHASIELGLGGPHAAIYAPGGEALLAFERAARAIAAREAPWALAGGADAPLDTVSLALHAPERRLAEGASLALLVETDLPAPGDVAFRGLHRAIDAVDAPLWIAVGKEAAASVPRGRQALLLDDRVGETHAASGALAVALAVQKLHTSVERAAVLALTDEGPLVAELATP